MADLPAITLDAAGQSARIATVARELRAYLDALLAMPRTAGVGAAMEGTAPAVGASQIDRIDHRNMGSVAGHEGIRERMIQLTCYVRIRWSCRAGPDGEQDRIVAMSQGVFAAAAFDAATTPALAELGARNLSIDASSWVEDRGAANGDVEGTFAASCLISVRVAE